MHLKKWISIYVYYIDSLFAPRLSRSLFLFKIRANFIFFLFLSRVDYKYFDILVRESRTMKKKKKGSNKIL